MPSYERCKDDRDVFMEAIGVFRDNSDPAMANGWSRVTAISTWFRTARSVRWTGMS